LEHKELLVMLEHKDRREDKVFKERRASRAAQDLQDLKEIREQLEAKVAKELQEQLERRVPREIKVPWVLPERRATKGTRALPVQTE
jgi:hypothetical protein